MPYVYSTLTRDNTYVAFKQVTKDLNQPVKKVTVKGGTNVANKHVITPMGVATQVSDEDLAFLKAHPVFKGHMERGFIRTDDKKKDPERVITSSSMETRDASAPETPETLADKGAKVREGTETADKKKPFGIF